MTCATAAIVATLSINACDLFYSNSIPQWVSSSVPDASVYANAATNSARIAGYSVGNIYGIRSAGWEREFFPALTNSSTESSLLESDLKAMPLPDCTVFPLSLSDESDGGRVVYARFVRRFYDCHGFFRDITDGLNGSNWNYNAVNALDSRTFAKFGSTLNDDAFSIDPFWRMAAPPYDAPDDMIRMFSTFSAYPLDEHSLLPEENDIPFRTVDGISAYNSRRIPGQPNGLYNPILFDESGFVPYRWSNDFYGSPMVAHTIRDIEIESGGSRLHPFTNVVDGIIENGGRYPVVGTRIPDVLCYHDLAGYSNHERFGVITNEASMSPRMTIPVYSVCQSMMNPADKTYTTEMPVTNANGAAYHFECVFRSGTKAKTEIANNRNVFFVDFFESSNLVEIADAEASWTDESETYGEVTNRVSCKSAFASFRETNDYTFRGASTVSSDGCPFAGFQFNELWMALYGYGFQGTAYVHECSVNTSRFVPEGSTAVYNPLEVAYILYAPDEQSHPLYSLVLSATNKGPMTNDVTYRVGAVRQAETAESGLFAYDAYANAWEHPFLFGLGVLSERYTALYTGLVDTNGYGRSSGGCCIDYEEGTGQSFDYSLAGIGEFGSPGTERPTGYVDHGLLPSYFRSSLSLASGAVNADLDGEYGDITDVASIIPIESSSYENEKSFFAGGPVVLPDAFRFSYTDFRNVLYFYSDDGGATVNWVYVDSGGVTNTLSISDGGRVTVATAGINYLSFGNDGVDHGRIDPKHPMASEMRAQFLTERLWHFKNLGNGWIDPSTGE